ncbi:MAG: ATP-grasp domain-containing protein [Acidimicrobiales bacterium]|nr:ATP-grasp domain-containing protein [Acidimicrobiales bacterium]
MPVLQLVEAAAGRCDVLWMVDECLDSANETARLLRRFGPVVATGHPDLDETAAAVGAHDPDGMVTYFDSGMVKLADVAARLSLPFSTHETACALVDKVRQREMLSAAGLVVPKWWRLAADVGPEAAMEVIGPESSWPLVLKPRSESGSRHTFRANDAAHGAELLADIGSARQEMIAEEYLEGHPALHGSSFADYVSVETVVSAGTMSHIAITGRFPPAETFRETGFFVPAALDPELAPQVLRETEAALDALGVTVGCFHTEVKLTPDGPRIIEVNGRLGGGIPDMVVRATGVDLFKVSLDVALGADRAFDGPEPCSQVGYRLFLQPPPFVATVTAVAGVERLTDHPWIDSVTVHRGPGSRVDWRDGSRTFIVAVIGSAPDHQAVVDIEHLVRDVVKVSYSVETQ